MAMEIIHAAKNAHSYIHEKEKQEQMLRHETENKWEGLAAEKN